mgnify:CR=1 FL=1
MGKQSRRKIQCEVSDMINYFRELLREIKTIRMELENIRCSAEETDRQLRRLSAKTRSGLSHIRTEGSKHD